jgi:HNH endonuclease
MLKRKRFSPIERAFIALRADDCCEYCQILHDFSPDTFEIEHIIPLAEGGTNEFNNLAFSCGGCNSRKGYKIKATDPVSGSMVNLFNPRIDNWEEHFTWSDNFSIVEGSTPIGRATLALLHLNRKGVVNLRKALFAYGVHPRLRDN